MFFFNKYLPPDGKSIIYYFPVHGKVGSDFGNSQSTANAPTRHIEGTGTSPLTQTKDDFRTRDD